MKVVKPLLWTLASLLLLIVAAITVSLYIILTPSRLTPIIESQISKHTDFDISIGSVDLTLFSSFPDFKLEIVDLDFAPIAKVDTMRATVDIKQLTRGDIDLRGVHMVGADIHLSMDTLTRMGLLPTLDEADEEAETTPIKLEQNIYIADVVLSDISMFLSDEQSNISARIAVPRLTFDGSVVDNIARMELAGNAVVDKVNVADTIAIDSLNISQLRMAMGGSITDNRYDIDASTALNIASIIFCGEQLLSCADISLTMPATIDVDSESIVLDEATLSLNDLALVASGKVCNQIDNQMLVDMNITSNRWAYSSLVPLIPTPYRAQIKDLTKSGGALSADIHTFVDMSGAQKSNIAITRADMELGSNRFTLSGNVGDALGDVECDFNINANANIAEIVAFIPDTMDLNIAASGLVRGDITTRFKLEDATAANIERIYARGNFAYSNIRVNYNDTINLVDSRGKVGFNLAKRSKTNHLIDFDFEGDRVAYSQAGMGDCEMEKPSLKISMSNPMDTTQMISATCNYSVKNLAFNSDSISAHLIGVAGRVEMSSQGKNPVMAMTYHSDSLAIEMVDMVKANAGDVTFKARSSYDESQEKLLLRWNPLLNVDFNNGAIKMADIEPTIYIPAIKFDYKAEDMAIHDSRIIIEDSDFSLSGNIGNIRSWLERDDQKLIGELNYSSEHTNLDQLMALSQEFIKVSEGDDLLADTTDTEPIDDDEPTPFMVPQRVSLALTSQVKSALFNSKPIYDIKGKVVAEDGELVMDQVGFRSEAAKMYLTAIYRPERANHLFTGFNFHLVDIDIDALVDIIPQVDTLMPMLKDFEGRAEFHLAGEGYLNGRYEPKMSTLRGAMAIKGEDLVLLDGDTFTQLSKMLLFSKKARNVVDSLSVEATLFRGEMEIYPFLIAMDRWQGVISGRHNLDMNFDYHVSVVDCPAPIKLGVDIKGNIDDMKFNLAPCKYKVLYKPEKQGAVEKQIEEFKGIISTSLVNNLKRREDYTSDLE